MSVIKRINVLIIEDNEDDFFFIKKALANNNYAIQQFDNGTTGFNYLLDPQIKPDVVLLDNHLPGMNGIEILEKLGSKTKEYGFIFLTVDNSIDTVVKAMNAGALDFVVKSSRLKKELPNKVEKVFSICRNTIEKRESQANLKALIESGTDAIWSIDSEYNLLVCNSFFKDSYQAVYNVELKKGVNVLNFLPEQLAEKWRAKYDEALLGNKVNFSFNEEVNNKTNYFDIRLNPVLVDNKITGVSALSTNITSQKETELKLKEQNEAYESLNSKLLEHKDKIEEQNRDLLLKEEALIGTNSLLNATYKSIKNSNTELQKAKNKLEENQINLEKSQEVAQLGHYVFNITDLTWTCSNQLSELFGIKKGVTHDYEIWVDLLHPDSKEVVTNYFENLLVTKQSEFKNEYKIINQKTGQSKWVLGLGELRYDSEDEPVEMFGIIQDISERKSTREILEANEKELSIAQEIAHVGNWFLNLETNEVKWSNELYKIFGFDPDLPPPLLNKSANLFTPESWELLSSSINNTIETGTPYEIQLNLIKKDGSKGWMWAHGEAVSNIKGEIEALRGTIQDITERKENEKALADSEQYFRTIIEQSPIGVQIYNIDGYLIDSNLAWSKLWNVKHPKALINKFNVLKDPQLIKLGFDKYFKEVFSGKLGEEKELLFDPGISGLPGEKRHIKIRAYPLKNPDNSFDRVVILNEDITERKRITDELSKQMLLFETMFNSMTDAIVITNKNREITHVNTSFPKVMGYAAHEAIGKTTSLFYTDTDTYSKAGNKYYSKQAPPGSVYETAYKRKNGEIFPSETLGAKLYNKNGEWIGMIGVMRDITKRKENEKQINKLYTAVEQSANSIVITDIEGNIEYVNAKYSELTGYSKEETIGKNPRFLSAGKLPKEYYTQMWDAITNGNTWKGEFCNKTKSGILFWENVTITPLKNNKNEVINYLAIKEDITAQKHAALALKESEEKTKILFDSTHELAMLTDPNGKIITCNTNFATALNKTKEELIGNIAFDFLPKEVADRRKVLYEKVLLNKKPLHVEDENNGKHFSYSIQPILNNSNNITQIVVFARDITENVLAQKEILNATLMAEEKERTRIARDIHDSISPMLSAIKIYTQSLQKYDSKEVVEEVHTQLKRIVNETIDGLSEISNNLSPHVLQNFGLQAAIENFIKKINNPTNIDIHVKSNSNKRIDKNIEIAIFRVSTELINNSVKYSEANSIQIILELNDKLNYQFVENGKGFNYDEVKTKSKGMGLRNIESRIEAIGGTISINSKNGVKIDIAIPIN